MSIASRAGTPGGMSEHERSDEGTERGITSPDEHTKDATTPPENPETDGAEGERAADDLEQAGGGH